MQAACVPITHVVLCRPVECRPLVSRSPMLYCAGRWNAGRLCPDHPCCIAQAGGMQAACVPIIHVVLCRPVECRPLMSRSPMLYCAGRWNAGRLCPDHPCCIAQAGGMLAACVPITHVVLRRPVECRPLVSRSPMLYCAGRWNAGRLCPDHPCCIAQAGGMQAACVPITHVVLCRPVECRPLVSRSPMLYCAGRWNAGRLCPDHPCCIAQAGGMQAACFQRSDRWSFLHWIPLCARTRLVRDLFLMLHCLSGTVSLSKSDRQTHSHLSTLLIMFQISPLQAMLLTLCVCGVVWCVCVCVYWCHGWVGGGGGGVRACKWKFIDCFGPLLCNWLYAPI